MTVWLSHDTTSLLRFLVLRIFHNSLYGSLIFPISPLSSSVYSLSLEFSWLISSFFSLIVSIVLHSLILSPFQHLQFLSSFAQYSSSYLLSVYPYNFLAVNLPGNSPLLNVSSSLFCLLISSISLLYSFSNFSITSFALSRFSFPSQVSDSTVNPFYHTRYLSFPLICCLFNILSTFHSSSPLIITGAGCSFLCPSTCSTYLYILLMLTTGCILIVAGSFSSTTFIDTIFLIVTKK